MEDKGVGIPAHLHERIWDLFQRGTSSHEGNGIGLSIVKKSVQRMGGAVGVISTEGQGSRFWMELNSKENQSG